MSFPSAVSLRKAIVRYFRLTTYGTRRLRPSLFIQIQQPMSTLSVQREAYIRTLVRCGTAHRTVFRLLLFRVRNDRFRSFTLPMAMRVILAQCRSLQTPRSRADQTATATAMFLSY